MTHARDVAYLLTFWSAAGAAGQAARNFPAPRTHLDVRVPHQPVHVGVRLVRCDDPGWLRDAPHLLEHPHGIADILLHLVRARRRTSCQKSGTRACPRSPRLCSPTRVMVCVHICTHLPCLYACIYALTCICMRAYLCLPVLICAHICTHLSLYAPTWYVPSTTAC
ncbi:hypothetical protein C8Q70DRAFT_17084 [Cubamyces menziesii]|nr:hypothetical protein C8Q70DRAFT_17084 [Cubamyces menziesii]